jgi:hypothetical protein
VRVLIEQLSAAGRALEAAGREIPAEGDVLIRSVKVVGVDDHERALAAVQILS